MGTKTEQQENLMTEVSRAWFGTIPNEPFRILA